jgi:hypothetical protein
MGSKTAQLASHPCRMKRENLCVSEIRLGLLMCRVHWYMVPKTLRDRINLLWDQCRGNVLSLDPEYFVAVREAVASVKAQLETV